MRECLLRQLSTVQPVHPDHPDKRARAITGKQTERSHAFIRDYSTVETCVLAELPTGLHARQKLQADVLQGSQVIIPQHARILRVTSKGGSSDTPESASFEVAFGVPGTEHSFISEAVKTGHPSNIFDAVSSGILRAVEANCSWKTEVVIMDRASWLKKWTSRALELAAEEEALHSRLPGHRKKILEGKRLLILREILAEEKYPDLRLVDDIEAGFDLVGTCVW